MIKKVKVNELKPGMYIHDLNCGWLEHPFLTNSLKVRDEKIISKLASYGIQEVYIDTAIGLDLAEAPTLEDVQEEIQTDLARFIESKPEKKARVPLKEEIKKAVKIQKEAKQTVNSIMNDVRFGKQVETDRVEHVVEDMVESIFRNEDALISLSKIRRADEYTYMHSMTVGILMLSFGKHLGYDKDVLREVGVGAVLHDAGKMKVPNDILTKKSRLTDDEFALMREHVVHSRTLLEKAPGISEISVVTASQHHERFDGSGYPHKLKADEISHFGQAIAITDVYDAMTSKRCYQKRIAPTEVLKKLYEWSDYHFNRELVQHFIRCVGIYPIGSMVSLESGLLAVVIHHGDKSLLQPVVRAVYDTKKDKLIIPFDIDLSNAPGEQVVSHVSADKWNIEPERYL